MIIIRRPFVKWLAIGPLSVYVLSVLSVTLVYCDQTVGWIKIPIGMEVGLGPSHCIRCRPSPSQAPPKGAQAAQPQNFGLCLLWSNGWMDQDATWCRGRPRPRRHCVRLGQSFPGPCTERGTAVPRTFRPMSIVVKRLPISATAKYNGLPTGGHGETRTKNRNSFTVSVKSNSSFTSHHSGYSYSRHSAISPFSVSSLSSAAPSLFHSGLRRT